jgi:leucyl-tRNA synthetase
MYARFFTKALADIGQLGFQEPFQNLFTQGMITRAGAKMSKSRGNVISPSDYVERYGADTARCYINYIGPPDQGADWSDEGVGGIHRFLARLWRIAAEVGGGDSEPSGEPTALLRKTHWAIDKVTGDMQRFAFNTAIAAVIELVNDIYRHTDALRSSADGTAQLRFAIATAASLVFPFAPHLASEVYELMVGRRVWEEPWPEAEQDLLVSDEVEIAIQVNGKLRDTMEVPASTAPDDLKALARSRPRVQAHLDGRSVVKEVVVPGRLVNFVVR